MRDGIVTNVFQHPYKKRNVWLKGYGRFWCMGDISIGSMRKEEEVS
jgi:hypothetical protein